MENIFQNRRMPFYMFGEMLHLDCIPTEYWVPFICSRFEKYGKKISEEYATRICKTVKNYSSYVQQLAWNVMAETEKEVNEETLQSGISALRQQCHGLFVQQTEGLTTYQHRPEYVYQFQGYYPLGAIWNYILYYFTSFPS